MSAVPPTPDTEAAAPGRRRWLLAGLAALVVAALVVTFLFQREDTSGAAAAQPSAGASSATAAPSSTASAAAATPSATATATATAEATPTAAGSADLPPARPAVALDETVDVGTATVSVVSLEAIEGTATGPGNVSGPAVRVTVRVANGAGAGLALDGVVVTVTYGAGASPASPLEDGSARRFAGSLAAGATAQGVYVFSVPAAERGDVDVEVGLQPGAEIAVFSGTAG